MKQHFYSHIIETDSLVVAINAMQFTDKEKSHLISLIDSSLHHTVLDAILSELSLEDKQIFLRYMISNEDDKIWEHLNNKVDNIEEKIKKAANEIKKQLHDDLSQAM